MSPSRAADRAPSPLPFCKMHGLGNDFMVIDATKQRITLSADEIRAMADRHFGVGFDQLLLVEPAPHAGVDFGYRIFNADGGEVEQCGNGARCFARFVRDSGLTRSNPLRVQTRAGVLVLQIEADGTVRVDMGVPRFLSAEIPFLPVATSSLSAAADARTHRLALDGESIEFSVVNLGNPHAVLRVDDVAAAPVASLGPRLEHHASFPARVNVGFMQVLSPRRIRLRVHERGCGETLACGSGACAAVVAGRRLGLLEDEVEVRLPGGSLWIEWRGPGSPVSLRGAAVRVFEGRWLAPPMMEG